MHGIVIISQSDRGNHALVKNQRETREAKFLERQQFNLAYKVRFVTEEPFYKLFLFGRSKYLTPALTLPVAHDMMVANGAVPDKDFIIEEVEE